MSIPLDSNGLRWFDTSPSAGPDCMCSHCDQPIIDETPLRLWNAAGQEARLHQRCFALRTGAPPQTEFVPLDEETAIDEPLTPGPCCACGRSEVDARNVIALAYRAPVPGTGWGCVVCGLPSDGAIAVVCDRCLELDAPIHEVCHGYVSTGKRLNRIFVTEPFDHKNIPH